MNAGGSDRLAEIRIQGDDPMRRHRNNEGASASVLKPEQRITSWIENEVTDFGGCRRRQRLHKRATRRDQVAVRARESSAACSFRGYPICRTKYVGGEAKV